MVRYKVKKSDSLTGRTIHVDLLTVPQIELFSPSLGQFLKVFAPEEMTFKESCNRYSLLRVRDEETLGELLPE